MSLRLLKCGLYNMPKGVYVRPTVEQRFFDKVNKTEGCWLWVAPPGESGYGYLAINRRPVLAHRFSYELHNGPIPEGLQVNHTCDVRTCVNPEHLYSGTQQENMRDRDTRGRNPMSNKTHCKRGHPYDEENTYNRLSSRSCRACNALRGREKRRV